MDKPYKLSIGIDVGATKIAAALVTDQGQVLHEERITTNAPDGPEAVIARMAQVCKTLLAKTEHPVAGIGIGVPGYVDPILGVVRNAVNLGWQKVDLSAQLRTRIKDEIGIWVDNDTNGQALGEHYFGAAQGFRDVVYVGIGSGLGSGILVHGKLVAGDTHTAAEIGHLSLDPTGRRCACGLRGCVETVVSGPGILASARERLSTATQNSILCDTPDLTPERIVEAAQAGDTLARDIFTHAGYWLGIAFAAYVAILNPARIIVGGGMGRSGFDLMVPPALAEMRRRVASQSFDRLVVTPSQVTSSAVGASCLVWHTRGSSVEHLP